MSRTFILHGRKINYPNKHEMCRWWKFCLLSGSKSKFLLVQHWLLVSRLPALVVQTYSRCTLAFCAWDSGCNSLPWWCSFSSRQNNWKQKIARLRNLLQTFSCPGVSSLSLSHVLNSTCIMQQGACALHSLKICAQADGYVLKQLE